ncbi:MAG: hypothetical protein FWD80_04565 [Propionibacteriaceae bacterium]|nr:hypothetical protein [Propionibacteriaceae bacterium]
MQSSQQRESERAQVLIDRFVAAAQAAGLAPVELRARTVKGRFVKTNVQGWYIRNDHSVAIGTDGGYYQLVVFGGLMVVLRGVELSPVAPPLVVGRGAKDGESGDLKDFLDRTLAGQVR